MTWNVSGNQAWLTTSESNCSGNTTITLTVEENVTWSDRYATVTVYGADATNEEI